MKTLYRFLTAALWALCLGMTALADLLPPQPEPEPEPWIRSPLTIVFILALVVIAAAVLVVILRRRKH